MGNILAITPADTVQLALIGGVIVLTVLLVAIFAPQVALYGVGVVLAGVLQAHRRFLAAALAPLLSSLVVIGAYVAYRFAAEVTV